MIRLDSGESLETAMRDGQLASSKIAPVDVSLCDYYIQDNERTDATRDADVKLAAAAAAEGRPGHFPWLPISKRIIRNLVMISSK